MKTSEEVVELCRAAIRLGAKVEFKPPRAINTFGGTYCPHTAYIGGEYVGLIDDEPRHELIKFRRSLRPRSLGDLQVQEVSLVDKPLHGHKLLRIAKENSKP